MEETYFIVKPDFIERKNIKYLFNEVQKRGLSITSKKMVKIDSSQISTMWPHLMRDPVSFFLQNTYIAEKSLPLYFVEGENAISIIDSLKINIRSKFAKWQCGNCMHAPKNYYEYIKDMEVIFGKLSPVNLTWEKFDNMPFEKYNNLQIVDFKNCASLLWDTIKKTNYDLLCDALMNIARIKKQKCILLKNDDSNKLNYVVAALYEYLPNITIEWAYYIVMAADWKGQFPIFLSNDNNDIKKLISYLDNLNIQTQILDQAII